MTGLTHHIDLVPTRDLRDLRQAKAFGQELTEVEQEYLSELEDDLARSDAMQARRELLAEERHKRANPEQRHLARVRPEGVTGGTYLVCAEQVLVHQELYLQVFAPAGLSFLPKSAPREQLEQYLRNLSNRALVVEMPADDFEEDPRAAIKEATGDHEWQVARWLELAMANVAEVFEARFSDDPDDPDDPGEQEQDDSELVAETEAQTETETNNSTTTQQEVA